MRIQWIPRYTIAAASTRLRVHVPAGILGWAEPPAVGVMMIQKAVDALVFEQARRFAEGGGRVVYDFDDVMPQAVLLEAARSASLFTVDTRERLGWFRERGFQQDCEIWPDPIDYQPTAPLAAGGGEGAAWFGNIPNFICARWMLEALRAAGAPLRIIAESPCDAFPFTRWEYATFPGELRRSRVAVLSHLGTDQGKSENKMVAAITLGVPCIVADSISYRKLAQRCGLDWCYVRGADELLAAWQRLQDDREVEAYLAAAQPVIWENYRAEVVAARLLEILHARFDCR